jgi:uncharacterized protein
MGKTNERRVREVVDSKARDVEIEKKTQERLGSADEKAGGTEVVASRLTGAKAASEIMKLPATGIPPVKELTVADHKAMRAKNPGYDVIKTILRDAQTIAVVGASNDPAKPVYNVMKTLIAAGYTVIPVNPKGGEILGLKAYPTLAAIPEKVDVVDVFRPSADTPAIAEQAAAIGAKSLWLQLGIANEQARTTATGAGMQVIMDLCIGNTHTQLKIPAKTKS